MMSVFEMLPTSRLEFRLSTTGKRSELTSENLRSASLIPCVEENIVPEPILMKE